jgi:hypothetical protein
MCEYVCSMWEHIDMYIVHIEVRVHGTEIRMFVVLLQSELAGSQAGKWTYTHEQYTPRHRTLGTDPPLSLFYFYPTLLSPPTAFTAIAKRPCDCQRHPLSSLLLPSTAVVIITSVFLAVAYHTSYPHYRHLSPSLLSQPAVVAIRTLSSPTAAVTALDTLRYHCRVPYFVLTTFH